MLSRSQVLWITALSLALLWILVQHRVPDIHDAPIGAGSRKPAFRQRLVAVGDLHGDVAHAQKVLRMANVIDDTSAWIAGTDILVQTGDIVDRGTYALDIYRMMRNLREQASAHGGGVVSILGNHEIMNAIGDWRYVTSEDIKRFGSIEERRQSLSVDGWLGQEWLANYSATASIALGPYPSSPRLSFTHGSLRPSYSNLTPYPSAINSLGHSLLLKALTPPLAKPYPPNRYSGLPNGSTKEEAELYAEGGPFWWRGLAEMPDEAVVCDWARELREKLGVRRIVGGHTPNFERIVDRCNASIIIIDTGISSAYGGVLSALEIVYTLTNLPTTSRNHHQDPFFAASPEVKHGHRFVEREEVNAIYEKRKKLMIVEEREITM